MTPDHIALLSLFLVLGVVGTCALRAATRKPLFFVICLAVLIGGCAIGHLYHRDEPRTEAPTKPSSTTAPRRGLYTMNKQELVKHLSEAAENIGKSAATAVVEELASVAGKKLLELGEFTIPGIGKLKLTVRAARTGRNPKTGEAVEIPEKTAVKFVAAKQLKDTATA